jgi:hypothetical protein
MSATRAPLYGHTSEETAYLVADYPYGRTVRCRIRYWLDYSAKRGFRLCSQTEHPDTLQWNKPKKGTYHLIAACLYLDENQHVQCATVNEYTKPEGALSYANTFPGADHMGRLAMWAAKKVSYLEGCLSGRIVFTINGEPRPWSELEQAGHAAELAVWRNVFLAAKPVKPGGPVQ